MSADMEDSGPALAQRVAALERRMLAIEAALLKRGDMSVNDVRAGLGLPAMRIVGADSQGEAVTLRELRDLQLATGIISEEERALLTERDAGACRD